MICVGQIHSVNIGSAETATCNGRTFLTGFRKRPVGPISVQALGLADDAQMTMHLHDGDNAKAVYAYASEDYEWFAGTYDITPEVGLFGAIDRDMNLPSMCRDFASTRVNRRNHPLRELIYETTARCLVVDEYCPNDDLLCAGGKGGLRMLELTNAAANLHRDVDGPTDGLERGSIIA